MKFLIWWMARLALLILCLFELANLAGILKFTLDFSWLGLLLTALAVWLFFEVLNCYQRRKFQRDLPGFLFITAVAMLLVDAGGDVLKFYSRFWWYDQMAHALGGMVVAGVLFSIVWRYYRDKNSWDNNKFFSLWAIFGTAFFAVLYEVEEYLETLVLHNNRLGDRFDTPNDLLWTVLGGVLGTLLVVFYRRRKKFFR